MYKSIYEIKRKNEEIGHFWFHPDTMRFFSSRVSSRLYGGCYFISSERFDENSPRLYTIHKALPTGEIGTIGEFQMYKSRNEAIRAISKLLE